MDSNKHKSNQNENIDKNKLLNYFLIKNVLLFKAKMRRKSFYMNLMELITR